MNYLIKKLLLVSFLCPIIWMIWFHGQILLLNLFVQRNWGLKASTPESNEQDFAYTWVLLPWDKVLIFRILLIIRKSKIGNSEIGWPQHS